MNRAEHLLDCLAEECNETAKRISKALRFGLSEVQHGQPLNNADRIIEELKDLTAVARILVNEGILYHGYIATETETAAKLAKIEKYMAISREQGTLA